MIKKICVLLAVVFCLGARAQTCTVTVNSGTICTGGVITLAATGATSYTWTPAIGLSSTTGSVVFASPMTTIVYTVTASTGTCVSTTNCDVVVASPIAPPTTSVNPVSICQGNSATLSVTPSGLYDIIVWYSPSFGFVATGNTYMPNTSIIGTTVYNIIDSTAWGPSAPQCTSSPLTLTVTISPSFPVTYTLVADIAPHTWDLYPTISGGVPPYTYNWSWGDGSANSTGSTPSHSYTTAGTYSICVSVTDANGCSSTYCQNDSVYRMANSQMVFVNVKSGTTGIPQYSNLNTNISIYPNPANTIIHVELKSKDAGAQYILYDINGKAVKQSIIYNLKSLIDISDVSEGVYNISISSNEGVLNKRVVIVR